MIKTLLLAVVLILGVSCSKDPESPEALIEKFVTDITSKKLNRKYFNEYTTGQLLAGADELNDEELENITLANIKKVKVKILKKKCVQSDECSVTYLVKYESSAKENKVKSEVKKIAEVVKMNKDVQDEKSKLVWKLSTVTNVKTYHEGQAIDVGPETTGENPQ